jgi:flagellar secretion chaperone FliS
LINSPYQKYQQASVQSSTPGQLLIMLYEGAIRFTRAGIEGIQSRNYEMANQNLKKAQSVVHELIAALNRDFALSNDLLRIYEYMLHQLIQANVRKNTKPAEEVLGYLTELCETWKQAAKLSITTVSAGSGYV